MLSIFVRTDRHPRFFIAFTWTRDARSGIACARREAPKFGFGVVVDGYALDEQGECRGTWHEATGFVAHHPISECRWTITPAGLDALASGEAA